MTVIVRNRRMKGVQPYKPHNIGIYLNVVDVVNDYLPFPRNSVSMFS
jgi:hypothetical protein